MAILKETKLNPPGLTQEQLHNALLQSEKERKGLTPIEQATELAATLGPEGRSDTFKFTDDGSSMESTQGGTDCE